MKEMNKTVTAEELVDMGKNRISDKEVDEVVQKLVSVALSEKSDGELEYDALESFETFSNVFSVTECHLGSERIAENFFAISQAFYDYKMKHYYHQVKYRASHYLTKELAFNLSWETARIAKAEFCNGIGDDDIADAFRVACGQFDFSRPGGEQGKAIYRHITNEARHILYKTGYLQDLQMQDAEMADVVKEDFDELYKRAVEFQGF